MNPLVFTGYALQQHDMHNEVDVCFELKGSEIDCPEPDYFDFVFTSPPYYKVEKYYGKQQSHELYKQFDVWLEKFLFAMAQNAWQSLVYGGYMLINISDCYANHEYNRICTPLIDFALSQLDDCELLGVMGYEIAKRQKGEHGGGDINGEPILVFRKGGGLPLSQILPEKKQPDLFD